MEANNAAALRDAVIKALTLLNVCDWPSGVSLAGVGEVIREIDSALDKPPRQCDVGTAEEQMEMFREFCQAEKCGRYRCRSGCKATCIDRCAIAWAQTPYEPKEGAGDD